MRSGKATWRAETTIRKKPKGTEGLRRWTEYHGTIIQWVFYRDGQADMTPIKDFRKSWEKACIAAGIPSRIVHDFRRTAVNLERAGVPRSVAMKLTGHLTEAVYRRYAIVCESDLTEAVNKLHTMFNLPRHSKQPMGIVSGIDAHKCVQNQSSDKGIKVAGNT